MKYLTKSLSCLLLATALVAAACNDDADNDGVKNSQDTTALDAIPGSNDTSSAMNRPADMNMEPDATFVSEAVSANLAEIAMHKAAEDHAATTEVKAHAKHMLTDHNKLLTDMQTYASQKGYSVPADASADKKEDLDEMNREKKGTAWDKKYLDEMIDDHKKDIKKFEAAENDVKDTELKNMISSALPILRSHLQMVEDAKKKMK